MKREKSPPPATLSEAFSSSQCGVVAASMFIQGASIVSFPDILVIFSYFFLPSQSSMRRAIISGSWRLRREPSSLETRVIGDMGCQLPEPGGYSNASAEAAKAVTRDCHVAAFGPNFIPGTAFSKSIAMSKVVDLATIPGRATNIIYRLGVQVKRFMSIQTFLLSAPAIAPIPAQECMRLGASVTEAYTRYALSQSSKLRLTAMAPQGPLQPPESFSCRAGFDVVWF